MTKLSRSPTAKGSSSSSDDCASPDENEKGEQAACNAKVVQGIFLLSSLSLCFHAAVLLKDGNYGRARAPRRAVPSTSCSAIATLEGAERAFFGGKGKPCSLFTVAGSLALAMECESG